MAFNNKTEKTWDAYDRIHSTDKDYYNDNLNPIVKFNLTFYRNYNFMVKNHYNIDGKLNITRLESNIDNNGNYFYNISDRVGDIHLFIYYKCGSDPNCTSLSESIEKNAGQPIGGIQDIK